jgi:hypothetical protein
MELKHPHFRREPKGGLVLQERDVRILELVHEHRFLSAHDLSRLLRHPGSAWAFQRMLRRLFDHRFLDRPPSQLILRFTGQERYLIYALGPRGAQVMAERYGLAMDPRRFGQKNAEVGDLYLRHTLGLGRFRICLTLAIPHSAPHEGTPDHSRPYLLPWKQGDELKAKVWLQGPSGRKDPWTLMPDAFVGVQKPKPAPNRSFFFIEYQRTTPSPQRFARAKGEAYLAFWRQGKHEERLGVKGFKVLIIAQTERKQETLRAILREWLEARPNPPWGLWLFTCEGRYDLERPETILDPIWKTAHEERLISLLE